jgi:FAD-linked sulfhydryl oxidase
MPSKVKPSPLDAFLKKHEDCDRPACDETVSALQSAMNRMKLKEASSNGASSSSAMSTETKLECPPNTRVLGTSSWNLLHSMAAWYPEKPSVEEQTKMRQFMEALSIFYPCTYCATDFQENIQKSPVKTATREDLCVWLCEQHNLVNEKLGKKKFNCDLKSLDERWRKSSDPRC